MNNSSGVQSSNNCVLYSDESRSSYAIKTAVFVVIGVCGILGNVFIIVLALKYTVRKNLHHLIVNMAVADTLVVLTTFALEIPNFIDNRAWKDISDSTGNSLCKLFGFFLSVGMWLTLVSLFLISVERFRATKILHMSHSLTLKQRVSALAACWLIVMALSSHELYQASVVCWKNSYYCNYFDPSLVHWNIALMCIATPIYVTIFILGMVTLRRLSKRQRNQVHLPEAQQKTRQKRMTNAIKLVLSSLFLYMGCYLPKIINNILDIVDYTVENAFENICYDGNLYDYMLICLPIANSCFSPCIYLIFMSDFRKAARKLLCKEAEPVDMGIRSVYGRHPSGGHEESSKASTELRERKLSFKDISGTIPTVTARSKVSWIEKAVI